jgi:hypothetical protein
MRAIPPIAKLIRAPAPRHRTRGAPLRALSPLPGGADLRRQVADVRRLVDRAWRDHARQLHWTQQLAWAIDELRLTMQMGSQFHAFASFAQFEALIRQLEEIGRQVGGWLKRQPSSPQGPESAAGRAAGACPDTEYPRRLA